MMRSFLKDAYPLKQSMGKQISDLAASLEAVGDYGLTMGPESVKRLQEHIQAANSLYAECCRLWLDPVRPRPEVRETSLDEVRGQCAVLQDLSLRAGQIINAGRVADLLNGVESVGANVLMELEWCLSDLPEKQRTELRHIAMQLHLFKAKRLHMNVAQPLMKELRRLNDALQASVSAL